METRQSASQSGYSNNLSSYHINYGSLEFGRELGRGGFGIVYEGDYAFDKVAIKKLHSHLLSKEHLEAFEREAEVMTRLRHPRTVQLYGVCLQEPDYVLVMEYMPNGSLAALLSSPKHIPWEQRYQIALDVGAGVAYLHQNGIVHCDLKSDNVLLDANYRAKVTDFGISRLRNENSTFGAWAGGTWGWMAPELMGDDPRNTKEADVYAYGVVLWELGARKKPFKRLNVVGVAKKVVEGKREPISEDTPPQMAELILDCWKKEPEARPTMPATIKFLKESPLTLSEDLIKLTIEESSVIQEIPSPIPISQPSEPIFYSENLLKAAENGHFATVQWLLVNGASISEKDHHGGTALIRAAWNGHLKVVQWLLVNGASINEKDNYDFTALLWAASNGQLEVVRWLLANGASISDKNNDGNTVLLQAAYSGQLEVVRWLLANGASISDKNNNGNTVLLQAASNGQLEVVRWLLANGASISDKNNYGDTALFLAAHSIDVELIKLLLANGASINEKDAEGKTIFDIEQDPILKKILRREFRPSPFSFNFFGLLGSQNTKPAPQPGQYRKFGEK